MSSLYTLRRVAENAGWCSGKSGTDESLNVHGDEVGIEDDMQARRPHSHSGKIVTVCALSCWI